MPQRHYWYLASIGKLAITGSNVPPNHVKLPKDKYVLIAKLLKFDQPETSKTANDK